MSIMPQRTSVGIGVGNRGGWRRDVYDVPVDERWRGRWAGYQFDARLVVFLRVVTPSIEADTPST